MVRLKVVACLLSLLVRGGISTAFEGSVVIGPSLLPAHRSTNHSDPLESYMTMLSDRVTKSIHASGMDGIHISAFQFHCDKKYVVGTGFIEGIHVNGLSSVELEGRVRKRAHQVTEIDFEGIYKDMFGTATGKLVVHDETFVFASAFMSKKQRFCGVILLNHKTCKLKVSELRTEITPFSFKHSGFKLVKKVFSVFELHIWYWVTRGIIERDAKLKEHISKAISLNPPSPDLKEFLNCKHSEPDNSTEELPPSSFGSEVSSGVGESSVFSASEDGYRFQTSSSSGVYSSNGGARNIATLTVSFRTTPEDVVGQLLENSATSQTASPMSATATTQSDSTSTSTINTTTEKPFTGRHSSQSINKNTSVTTSAPSPIDASVDSTSKPEPMVYSADSTPRPSPTDSSVDDTSKPEPNVYSVDSTDSSSKPSPTDSPVDDTSRPEPNVYSVDSTDSSSKPSPTDSPVDDTSRPEPNVYSVDSASDPSPTDSSEENATKPEPSITSKPSPTGFAVDSTLKPEPMAYSADSTPKASPTDSSVDDTSKPEANVYSVDSTSKASPTTGSSVDNTSKPEQNSVESTSKPQSTIFSVDSTTSRTPTASPVDETSVKSTMEPSPKISEVYATSKPSTVISLVNETTTPKSSV